MVMSEISIPSMTIRPEAGTTKRNSDLMKEDFPDPFRPTRATLSCGRREKDRELAHASPPAGGGEERKDKPSTVTRGDVVIDGHAAGTLSDVFGSTVFSDSER